MKEEKMKWINKLLLSIVWVGLVAFTRTAGY